MFQSSLKQKLLNSDEPPEDKSSQALTQHSGLFQRKTNVEADALLDDVLNEQIALLALAPTFIKKMTTLRQSKDKRLDASYFGLIKAAHDLFKKSDKQFHSDMQNDMKNIQGLHDAYLLFNLNLNQLIQLRDFFTKMPVTKNKVILEKYKLHQKKFNEHRKTIEEIIETCEKYHGFVRNVLERFQPPEVVAVAAPQLAARRASR